MRGQITDQQINSGGVETREKSQVYVLGTRYNLYLVNAAESTARGTVNNAKSWMRHCESHFADSMTGSSHF